MKLQRNMNERIVQLTQALEEANFQKQKEAAKLALLREKYGI